MNVGDFLLGIPGDYPFEPPTRVCGALADMTFGEIVSLCERPATGGRAVSENPKADFLATAAAMPHLASIVPLGYFAERHLAELDRMRADPVAYAREERKLSEENEADASYRRGNLPILARSISDEIWRGEHGQETMQEIVFGLGDRVPPEITLDPVADAKALQRPGYSDYWISGWRRMAARFGAEKTVGEFICDYLPEEYR